MSVIKTFGQGSVSRVSDARFLVASIGLAALMVVATVGAAEAGGAKTRRMTVGSGGTEVAGGGQDPGVSATGKLVAFASFDGNIVGNDTNGKWDVFIHNRKSRKTRRVSVRTDGAEAVGGNSRHPSVSGDGRFVAFESRATNLVAGDGNLRADIFVRDRKKEANEARQRSQQRRRSHRWRQLGPRDLDERSFRGVLVPRDEPC